MFIRTEVRKWGCKHGTNKTWPNGKAYFETLFTEKQTFQDDIGAAKRRFKGANNVGEAMSQRLPFD